MFDEFLKKADELVMIGESFVIATVVRFAGAYLRQTRR